MAAHDTARLLDWLTDHGASEVLLELVSRGTSRGTLEWTDRLLWCEGRLFLATEPRVDPRALDDAEAMAKALGITDDDWSSLIRSSLGITEVRLRAYAVLRLPLHATPEEVKEVHRAASKRLHPDRLTGASERDRAAAGRLLGQVNHARAVLLSKEEVVTRGEDDVDLDEPEDDVALEDPTWELEEVPTEADLTDVLERTGE